MKQCGIKHFAVMGAVLAALLVASVSAQSLDLSQWTFHAEAAQPVALGPLYPGDADLLGYLSSDEDADGSLRDLVVDLGDSTGDSFSFWRSPLALIPFTENGTYRITWRVRDENPSMQSPDFRLRHMYGAFGGLGNGLEMVTPGVALTTTEGRNYDYVFDVLDVAEATAMVGSPEIKENSVTLYFDALDLLRGVRGAVALESVTIQQIDREALLAAGRLERIVDDEWCSPELVGRTGAYNTGDGPPVEIQITPPCDHALIISPGPIAPTLTASYYGLSPNYLAFEGIGLVPFAPTPSAVTPAFFRAEFDLDFSGSTVGQPIAMTRITMAFFKDFGGGAIGQTLACESNINPRRLGDLGRNPALDSTLFGVYLAVPEGMSLDSSSMLGSLIGANVRQIDTTSAGGTLTVNSIRIDSFPEGLLP